MAGMIQIRSGLVIVAALCASACGQAAVGPQQAASAPIDRVEPTSLPDFREFVGDTYAEFAAQPVASRYDVTALGVEAAQRARFTHSMSRAAPGLIADGGGAQALIFSGCAPTGCLEGLSVVAVDVASGEVFVGVSDAHGADELVPNDRLEALLRLTSPSNTWDDPVRPSVQSASAP